MSKTRCEPRSNRLPALRRFAIAITALNLLGHFVFGFEQSWAQPLVALATAYVMELVVELLASRSERRPARFLGGVRPFVDFLLPAHISGLAVSMLLYSNDRLAPIAFASAAAIGSKVLVRVPVGGSWRHVLNPSNTGIAVTLLLFPWVGIAPPYHFTTNLVGLGDWLLPMFIIFTGTFLNTRFTGKTALLVGWLGGFVLQAWVRSSVMGTPIASALLPMTGVAFLLFTFYMVTDPGTTPVAPGAQFAFGATVAAAYGALMALHLVFGLFFALVIVSSLRGVGLLAWAASRSLAREPVARPEPIPIAVSASVALEGVRR